MKGIIKCIFALKICEFDKILQSSKLKQLRVADGVLI